MHSQPIGALLTLATKDLENLVLFYTKLLDQNPQSYLPGVYAEFKVSGLRLGIFQSRLEDRYEFAGDDRGRMSLCLEVAVLEEAIAHLHNIGCLMGEAIVSSYGREFYAYDPDGNRLILYQKNKLR